MRRTLAALVLAITPPLTVLAVSGVQAQQVVTVRTGETLSEIAERHGVSLSRLMQANGIANPDHVETGQRLTIPGSGSTARSSPSPSGTRGTAPYTVKNGETLSEIADRFNTTTARLIQINSISDPDLVMSGTRLQVPLTAQRSASAASSSPPVNRSASEHVVESGENLSLIAERYGTSVSRLVALNQLEDPELVTVGTRLKLRGTPPAPRSTPPAASKPRATPAAPPPAATTPAAQPVAAQPASAPAQPSGSATTPATTTTSATPTATTAATSATVAAATAAATAAAPLPGPATAATPAATAATAATTSAINRSAPVSAASRAPAAATRASSTAVGQATPVAAARPAGEWRNYGPLQVDWSKIQPMGGSYVAPSLNSEGQPLYLAVNCTARKINVTSQAGQWRTWENPSKDFEHKLVKDICQANRS